ncbi:MAG: hypothetical protein V1895_01365 [Parcubacteria group bacterium]
MTPSPEEPTRVSRLRAESGLGMADNQLRRAHIRAHLGSQGSIQLLHA